MGYPSALSAPTLGLPGCAVQGQAAGAGAALRQLRDGKRAVQDQLPGRIPRADRGGMRAAAAPAGAGAARRHRARSSSRRRSRACASSTRPGRWPTRPIATTASSTWCAIPLIFGRLTAADYEDGVARRSARRCAARAHARARRTPQFTRDYYAADKRYIGNALQVFFRDGSNHPARAGGLSHRPPPAARRGHSDARGEIRDGRAGALSGRAGGRADRVCSPDRRRWRRWISPT